MLGYQIFSIFGTTLLIYAMAAPFLTKAGLQPCPALYAYGCNPDAAKLPRLGHDVKVHPLGSMVPGG